MNTLKAECRAGHLLVGSRAKAGSEGSLGCPVPAALTAATRNSYCTPFLRPVTFSFLSAERRQETGERGEERRGVASGELFPIRKGDTTQLCLTSGRIMDRKTLRSHKSCH